MELYHAEVYMPNWVVCSARMMMTVADSAKMSHHLWGWIHSKSFDWLARYKHRYTSDDIKRIQREIKRNKPVPFEVGVERGAVVKYAVRLSLDDDNDISMVIDRNGYIRTAWINSKEDTHRTLDKSKYVNK